MNMESQSQKPVIDESSLRQYFRRVLEVSPGAGRKQLRQSRDRISSRLRERLAASQGQGEEKARLEAAMVLVNTAFDCLSRHDRFVDYFEKVNSGEIDIFAELELPPELSATVKPPPRKQLERRQQHTEERMERISALIVEAVNSAGREESNRQTATGSLPNADIFYDTVYDVCRAAGRRVKNDELAQATKSGKYNIDDECLAELDSCVLDNSEIVAHREYDRLESMAAQVEPPAPKSRAVALVLSLLILFLVGFYGWYAMTTGPSMIQNAANTQGSNRSGKGPLPNSYDTTQSEVMFEQGYLVPPLKDLIVIDKLISSAGIAGVAGPANDLTKPGTEDYQAALKANVSGDVSGAIELFKKSAQSDACKASGFYSAGTLLASQDKLDEALDCFSKALIANPALAQAYYNRALCHQMIASRMIHANDFQTQEKCSRHLQSALKNYDLCMRVDDRFSQCYYNRGWVFYMLGRTAPSIEDFDRASKISSMVKAGEYNRNVVILASNPKAAVSTPDVVPPPPIGPVGPPGPQ